jgi:hypothetical protein
LASTSSSSCALVSQKLRKKTKKNNFLEIDFL